MDFYHTFTGKFTELKNQVTRNVPRMRFVRNALGWWGLYQCATQSAFKFQHIVQMYMLTHYNDGYRTNLVHELKQDPAAAKLISDKVLIRATIDDLRRCKANTLGQAYVKFVEKNNIKPLIGDKDLKFYKDFHYIAHRLVSSHDIYHVVLGANTQTDGEGIVAGFTTAQIPSYVPPVVTTSAGLLRAATIDEHLVDFGLSNIIMGWLIGKSANQLFNVDWDKMWDKPLEEVRQLCQINNKNIQKELLQLHNQQIPLELFNRPKRPKKESNDEQ